MQPLSHAARITQLAASIAARRIAAGQRFSNCFFGCIFSRFFSSFFQLAFSAITRGLLMLCGAFLRMLLCDVMANHAATDGTYDGVMTCVVAGYTADDRALQAAGRIGRSGCHESQRGNCSEYPESKTNLHDGFPCDTELSKSAQSPQRS